MKLTNMDANQKIEFIANWIKQYLEKSNAKGIVFGVSGGIDSALISAIANKYFKNNHLALCMNIENDQNDVNDALQVVNHFHLNYKNVKLEKAYKKLKKTLIENDLSFGNIKSRLRMITLYSYAQQNNYLVVGTSNHIEIMIGYFTKYGDSGSDIIPLANLLKKDIRELAKELGVPENIILKKPTAGLYKNQTDEEEIGITYDDLDQYFIDKSKLNKQTISKIENLIAKSKHKRKMPASPLEIQKVLGR